jgi:hypothetical protein
MHVRIEVYPTKPAPIVVMNRFLGRTETLWPRTGLVERDLPDNHFPCVAADDEPAR